jgi:hypothetical protein
MSTQGNVVTFAHIAVELERLVATSATVFRCSRTITIGA